MTKRVSKVGELLANQEARVRGRALRDSLPAEKYQEIEADLRAVVRAKLQGRSVPPVSRVLQFVREEHGVDVSFSCVRDWLKRLESKANAKR